MLRALVVVLLVVLAPAGCADAPVTPPAPDPAAVDAAFLSGMIPHHEQALDLTAMVDHRDVSPGLDAVALRIDREQVEEIGQMQGLARARGLPVTTAPHGGHDMPGMADRATLDRLRTLQGPAFERSWLDTMIRHHEGALVMAHDYLAVGTDETLRRFSRVLLTSQSREIAVLQELRTSIARP
ncbi:DUF305 domain-containing protein [Actinomycetospora cinnamomea]|uniref:Uncharacterized protein (DUF305 family) n=1 Tax=Actinomycetospora cinnamomea TaxID=663609 RepID=A0A2U1F126_9PSEU|nr:DUF305 domain-containing protein [Actinomycetospora cinnamomea]PVZ05871.1 uncharacterized protein (DUF305 family) [Actinomycetospora cinnamomea]